MLFRHDGFLIHGFADWRMPFGLRSKDRYGLLARRRRNTGTDNDNHNNRNMRLEQEREDARGEPEAVRKHHVLKKGRSQSVAGSPSSVLASPVESSVGQLHGREDQVRGRGGHLRHGAPPDRAPPGTLNMETCAVRGNPVRIQLGVGWIAQRPPLTPVHDLSQRRSRV